MKKLSEINEGMFSGMVRRANTDQVKKEDIPDTNINEMKTSICINGVYWSNIYLQINRSDVFSISDVNKIPSSALKGWRIPTRDDFKNLKLNGFWKASGCYSDSVFDNIKEEGNCIEIYNNDYYMIQETSHKANVAVFDNFSRVSFKRIPTEIIYKNNDPDDIENMIDVLLVRDNELN